VRRAGARRRGTAARGPAPQLIGLGHQVEFPETAEEVDGGLGGRVEAALGAPFVQQAGPACKRLAGVQVRAHADGAIDAVEMQQVGVGGSIAIRGQPACMVLRKCNVSTKCPSITRWSARLLRPVVDCCVCVL